MALAIVSPLDHEGPVIHGNQIRVGYARVGGGLSSERIYPTGSCDSYK